MNNANPAERITIDKIDEGRYVDGIFHCRSRRVAMAKNNKTYISMVLSDKTGEIVGMAFDNAEKLVTQFQEGDFVYIQSKAQSYQGRLQLLVTHIEQVPVDEVDVQDFLPVSKQDPVAVESAIRKLVKTIEHPGLRKLAVAILDDPEIGKSFFKAPAAAGIHHAFIGGLAEHTLSVCLLADKIAEHYSSINRDVLLIGALVHDIGKVKELSYELTIDYTTAGRLIGHLVIGVQIVRDAAAKIPELDAETLDRILHIVVSHHGTHEFGSPKLPATVEAIVIHHLDNIDAKVFSFLEAIQDVRSDWTDFIRHLDTKVYRGADSQPRPYSFNPEIKTADDQPPAKPRKMEAANESKFQASLFGDSKSKSGD